MLTVPFSIDNLKKIISGEIASPEIDLASSSIKNQTLLTYLYNLNIKDVKANFQNMSTKEKRDLFLAYANHKTIVEVEGFSETYLKFLFNLKEINEFDEDAQEEMKAAFFTDEEVTELMNTDVELREAIEHAAFVLDGIIIHMIINTNDVKIELDEDFGKIGILKDPQWVGHTWVNLLKHPVFNAYYYSKMPEMKELVYFPYQYCEPIYKGKPLFDYLNDSVVVTTLYEMALGFDKKRGRIKMIAHLFSKIYLNFDVSLRPVFDTMIISDAAYAIHESFINKHVGMGKHHGNYVNASEVDWKSFFNNAGSKRTVVYVNPVNFGTVYFSFLKTINPDITFDNAKKIIEIVLKRAEMYFVEYPNFGSNQTHGARKEVADHIAAVREKYQESWDASQSWELDETFITNNLGVEYLVARYWIDGSNEQILKDKLEGIYWKVLVGWGEEQMKNYSHRWLNLNPGVTPDMFFPAMAADPELSWMADPDLDLEKTETFKQRHDWSTIEKIFAFLKNDGPNGVIIETEPHWDSIIAKDWDAILNKDNPMTLIAPAGEPVYRVLLNSWLISYFANLTKDQLKEFVL